MFSERILRAQSGSQEDMLFIIQKFEPQLKHYSRRLHSEDAQSELTLRFIETIHAMNLDSLRSQGDGTIVAYLAQSVRNAYISLLPFKKTVEPPVSWEELTEAQLLGLVAPIREREVLDFSELLDTCPELTKKERKVLTLLEDLYYGEIRTHDREIDMDSELGKAVGRAERCKEKLAALLEGEAKALLLRLIDADSEISNTLALENFIQGFRLGMRLAMEGLDEAEGVDRA